MHSKYMENPLQTHWTLNSIYTGHALQIHRKSTSNLWEVHSKYVENPLEIHGTHHSKYTELALQIHWKSTQIYGTCTANTWIIHWKSIGHSVAHTRNIHCKSIGKHTKLLANSLRLAGAGGQQWNALLSFLAVFASGATS